MIEGLNNRIDKQLFNYTPQPTFLPHLDFGGSKLRVY